MSQTNSHDDSQHVPIVSAPQSVSSGSEFTFHVGVWPSQEKGEVQLAVKFAESDTSSSVVGSSTASMRPGEIRSLKAQSRLLDQKSDGYVTLIVERTVGAQTYSGFATIRVTRK